MSVIILKVYTFIVKYYINIIRYSSISYKPSAIIEVH